MGREVGVLVEASWERLVRTKPDVSRLRPAKILNFRPGRRIGVQGQIDPTIVEGATLDEALEKAEALLGVSRDKLEVEVVQEASAGFLGIGARPAIIKAWPKQVSSDVPGTARVEGGQLLVEAPKGAGGPAQVVPREGLKVFVNGALQEGPFELWGNEEVKVEFHDEEPTWEARVEIDSDGMGAYLVVEATAGRRHQLEDRPSSPSLVLAATVKERPLPKGQSPAELKELLQQAGVVYGIDEEAVAKASALTETERVLVAQGTPPVPPVDEWIEYAECFSEGKRVVNEDAQRIDFYEMTQIPSVEEGAVLAVKHEGQPGKPGMKVTGEVIEPRPPKKVNLRAGQGVALIEGGLKAVAVVSGKPSNVRGLLKVLPVYTVAGDAGLATGNIRFTGHVLIQGDVAENVQVYARGTVRVGGIADGAQIEGVAGISVEGSIISSTMRAASVGLVCECYAPSVLAGPGHASTDRRGAALGAGKALEGQFDELSVRMLVERKFTAMGKAISALREVVEKCAPRSGEEELHGQLLKLATDMGVLLPPKSFRATSLQEMEAQLEAILQMFDGMGEETADIKAVYVQNSHLEASGTISIAKACYNSTLIAGRGIAMEGGTFRGGKMTVHEGNIVVRELGSPNEAQTLVFILKGGLVRAGTVHPNVRVVIGREARFFTERLERVTMFINREGEFHVSQG